MHILVTSKDSQVTFIQVVHVTVGNTLVTQLGHLELVQDLTNKTLTTVGYDVVAGLFHMATADKVQHLTIADLVVVVKAAPVVAA